jgi:hypothetical protein
MNHKYRKKPIQIEAFQLTKESRKDFKNWPRWLRQAYHKLPGENGAVWPWFETREDGALKIYTSEGLAVCHFGAWIIKGTKGELSVCAPDIFETTYEPVK